MDGHNLKVLIFKVPQLKKQENKTEQKDSQTENTSSIPQNRTLFRDS